MLFVPLACALKQIRGCGFLTQGKVTAPVLMRRPIIHLWISDLSRCNLCNVLMSSIYSPSTNTFPRKSATSVARPGLQHIWNVTHQSGQASSCISLSNQRDQKLKELQLTDLEKKKKIHTSKLAFFWGEGLPKLPCSRRWFRLPRHCLSQHSPLIYTPAAQQCRAGQQGGVH